MEKITEPVIELNQKGKKLYHSIKYILPGFADLIELEIFANKLISTPIPKKKKREILKDIKGFLDTL